MTILSILDTLVIGPLKLLFEYIFHFSNAIVANCVDSGIVVLLRKS